MTHCCVEGCNQDGAFTTRSRPTWCLGHLWQLYYQGDLTLLEEFTKPAAYLMTRCTRCGFEGHYRFEYVLDRIQEGESVCRACYWRTWAKNADVISGSIRHPEDVSAVKKNAEAHGYTYLGPLTELSLEGDPHATRCNSCGRIEAQRNGDISWGCSCRRNPKSATVGTKKTRGSNLLKNSSNRAVGWWDHDRNEESLWDTATLRGRGEAWWLCPKGHSFKARILEVTNERFSCPVCQKISLEDQEQKLASFQGKTVADVPELLAAWDDTLPPESVLLSEKHWGSGYRFRCPSGHRNTREPLSYLFEGCSSCKAIKTRKANAEAAKADPSSSRLTPEISSQWHPVKNGRLCLAEISPNSRRLVWWRDPICGHEFQATPRERDKYERLRCPVCHTILDSLAYHYPELADEWSPENSFSPWEIRPNTSQLKEPPLWVCKNDPAHTWRAMPAARVNGAQCPECVKTGKSLIEMEYYSAAIARWGNAKSGSRIRSEKFHSHSSWAVDICVDLPSGKRLVIEYDGSYWHRDKADIDRAKSLDLLADGFLLVRLRENPLPSLEITNPNYHEFTVYPSVQDPVHNIDIIAETITS